MKLIFNKFLCILLVCIFFNINSTSILASGEINPKTILGDANKDGQLEAKDVTILRRYIAGGWEIQINTEICDMDKNDSIDAKDVTILRRMIAGGWYEQNEDNSDSTNDSNTSNPSIKPDKDIIVNEDGSITFPMIPI